MLRLISASGATLQQLLSDILDLARVESGRLSLASAPFDLAQAVRDAGQLYAAPARAKGLPARQVIFKHALRNAVVPVVALAAVQLGYLLGGSVVVETIFALDGLGYLAYQSITFKDFPVSREEAEEMILQARLKAGWITEADLAAQDEAPIEEEGAPA